MFYDVRNDCKVCGKGVDGIGNATICTFCYNNHPELHTNDCACLNCQRKRATATTSVAPFADRLGAALGVTPVEEKQARPSKQNVYLDAGTSISRVIRSTGEHTGYVTNQGKPVEVAEVYDPVNEFFYWATESYAHDCQAQGQIVFW